jgi:hypothetical protein
MIKLREGDENLALSLLVRLRAGETVQHILQTVSIESMGDDLGVSLSMDFTSDMMSKSARTGQILSGTNSQCSTFSSLASGFPPAFEYSGNVLNSPDPMRGVDDIDILYTDSGLIGI